MDTRQEFIGDQWKHDPEYHRLAEFLEVNKYDRENFELAQKLSLIWDWSRIKKKSQSTEDGLWEIYNLRRKLGIQLQGKSLVNELYQYIRLDMDTKVHQLENAPQGKNNLKEIEKKDKKVPEEKEVKLNPEDVKAKLKEGTQSLTKNIESQVKRSVTSSINRGIQKALNSAFSDFGGKK